MTEKSIEELKKDLTEAKRKQKKSKQEGRFGKNVLITIYLTTMAIMIAYFYCILVVQVEPTAIIEWYFKCVIGEVGVLGIIKVVKTVFKK